MAISTTERETLLRAIAAWPPEDQVTFAQTILRQAGVRGLLTPRSLSWRQMAGLAAPEGTPAPTDLEIARWLDEHRFEKYGQP